MKVYCEKGIFNDRVVDAPKESFKTVRAGRELAMLRDEAGMLHRYARLRNDHELPGKKALVPIPAFRWDPFTQHERTALG